MILSFQGHTPEISDTAYISETADLIGDVKVEDGASVWFGAVARGDFSSIVIGARSNVQDNAVLHCEVGQPVRIGEGVTIGHSAIVHSAEIGDYTLIGMGSVILSGAVIGDHCVIAAGAVVKENAVIPAGSMVVGVPGKVIRQLTEEQMRMREEPSPYLKYAETYRMEQKERKAEDIPV